LYDKLANPFWLAFIFIWLFGVVMGSALNVVRHADHVSQVLGEPYGPSSSRSRSPPSRC
jgi:Ca2+:H+ antiporter